MLKKYSQIAKTGEVPVQGCWLLVMGGEEHCKRLLVERLRTQLLQDEDAYNFELLDVNDRWEGVTESSDQSKRERMPDRADRILALAQALPFFGDSRLLMVRNIDLLPNDQQKKLAASLASVPPCNHVLLITGESEAGKKAAKLAADLQKGIEKSGVIYDCSPLSEDDAAQWVTSALREWQQTIEPGALRLLLSRVGTDLRRLQIEVEKLSLMIGDSGVIRLSQVEMMTPKLAEESVFHLTDAVAARDARRATEILRELLEEQLESPYRIFPLIVRQFRMIWQTKVLLDAGWKPRQDPMQFSTALAILPEQHALGQIGGWIGSKLAGPARQMSWVQLTGAYQALLECDMASKAIEGVPRQEMDIALEMLCVKLCLPPSRR